MSVYYKTPSQNILKMIQAEYKFLLPLFHMNLTALVTQIFQRNDKTSKTMSELGHSSYFLNSWKENSRILCTNLYFSWNSKSIYHCTNEYKIPPFQTTPTFAIWLFWWSRCCWICISVRARGEKTLIETFYHSVNGKSKTKKAGRFGNSEVLKDRRKAVEP